MLSPSDHLLRTFAAVPQGQRVLNVGCGRGRHTVPLVQLGFEVHACDTRPEAVDATRSGVREAMGASTASERITQAEAAQLAYPDAHFDWVVAYRGYGGSPSRRRLQAALAETRRVLRPGGWVYLVLPSEEGPERFSTEAFKALMQEANLAVAERPKLIEEDGRVCIRAIYRRVDDDTPV